MTLEGSVPRPLWTVASPVPDDVVAALGMPRLWAQVLYNRGIQDAETAQDMLDATHNALHDPFLFDDMDIAVRRILQAIRDGETIAVFGDFDTDGVTATVLLYESLKQLGGTAIAHIPHRVRDGHGLNIDAVNDMRSRGATLVITVDCGITSVEEVRSAKELGMEVILTDHHAPLTGLPDAFAIVTPRRAVDAYPFPFLTGAGIAFKLVQALHQVQETEVSQGALELAALGTVADMAPLLGENRALATLGLAELRRTKRPGLLALLEAAHTTSMALDHESIPFVIAPRLNAAGRMDTADLSFDLLTAPDMDTARELAAQVEQLNQQRRELTGTLVEEGVEQASQQVEGESLIFLASEEFEPGVSGLVAGRLVERFYRPAIVVSIDGDIARASGRSIPEFNLGEALASCEELFHRFGGHPAAAGFVADTANLEAIKDRLQALAREQLKDITLEPTLKIDAEVDFKNVLGETYKFLRSLAPFGQEHAPPSFLAQNVEVTDLRQMGTEGQHMRLTLRQSGAKWDAVAFNLRWPEGLAMPENPTGQHSNIPLIDVVYIPEINNFNGRSTMQFRLLDLRASD